jgi:hypothetical protein
VKIKMVVGEIIELNRMSESGSKSGFHRFMWQLWARLDHDTGEIELDDTDLARIYRYRLGGYKKKLLFVFGRTLGPDLGGLGR